MKEVELLCVRKGCTLYWPSAIGGALRGGAGTIVRRDDPLLNFGGANQMHVFCGAPENAAPTPHGNPQAEALYAGWEHRPEFIDASAKPFVKAVRAASKPKPPAPPSSSSKGDSSSD